MQERPPPPQPPPLPPLLPPLPPPLLLPPSSPLRPPLRLSHRQRAGRRRSQHLLPLRHRLSQPPLGSASASAVTPLDLPAAAGQPVQNRSVSKEGGMASARTAAFQKAAA